MMNIKTHRTLGAEHAPTDAASAQSYKLLDGAFRFLSSALAAAILGLGVGSVYANPHYHAHRAARATSGASTQSAASAGHSLAATGKLASGAVAIPLSAAGLASAAASSVVMESALGLVEIAQRPIGEPLPLAEESISIISPSEALRQPSQPKQPERQPANTPLR